MVSPELTLGLCSKNLSVFCRRHSISSLEQMIPYSLQIGFSQQGCSASTQSPEILSTTSFQRAGADCKTRPACSWGWTEIFMSAAPQLIVFCAIKQRTANSSMNSSPPGAVGWILLWGWLLVPMAIFTFAAQEIIPCCVLTARQALSLMNLSHQAAAVWTMVPIISSFLLGLRAFPSPRRRKG